jgi:hypothetical protein
MAWFCSKERRWGRSEFDALEGYSESVHGDFVGTP